jgi:hypothetical protein
MTHMSEQVSISSPSLGQMAYSLIFTNNSNSKLVYCVRIPREKNEANMAATDFEMFS